MSKKFKRHPTLKRVGDKWRKPKSGFSRIKQKWKGKNPMPTVGYGTSGKERGLHPSGLAEVLVNNPGELDGLKDVVVRIASGVGRKKKEAIVSTASEKKLRVLNIPTKKPESKETKKDDSKEETDEKKTETPKTSVKTTPKKEKKSQDPKTPKKNISKSKPKEKEGKA